MSPDLRSRIRGIQAFPITPFRADLSLDLKGLRANTRRLLKTDASCIFVCGWLGELLSLTFEEYEKTVAAVVEEVDERKPVLAGVAHGTATAMKFARRAERLGAKGLLILPPAMMIPDDDGLLRHFRAVAESVSIPSIVYSRDWFSPSLSFLEKMARIEPIFGFKEGQFQIELVRRIKLKLGDRLFVTNGGPAAEMIVAEYTEAGAEGFASGFMNFMPEIVGELVRAHARGDRGRYHELLRKYIEPLCEMRDRRRGYFLAMIKAAMNELGLPAGPTRPPAPQMSPSDLPDLKAFLRRERVGRLPADVVIRARKSCSFPMSKPGRD
jgi:5-dehydro-4-deoxyglucarate dehydratase